MAITSIDVHAFRILRRSPLWRQGMTLGQIGEANWFGDSPTLSDTRDLWKAAEEWWKALEVVPTWAVDLHGHSPETISADLNHRGLREPCKVDLVYNSGTAEHVFDVANVFRFAHDACKVGGWMVHQCPMTGWIDHGFWSIQPNVFRDLAAANGYQIDAHVVGEIDRGWALDVTGSQTFPTGSNTIHVVAMRKVNGSPFKIPRQGEYSEAEAKRLKVPA